MRTWMQSSLCSHHPPADGFAHSSRPFPIDPDAPEETHQLTLRALIVGCLLGAVGELFLKQIRKRRHVLTCRHQLEPLTFTLVSRPV